jgi:hypothetical protein
MSPRDRDQSEKSTELYQGAFVAVLIGTLGALLVIATNQFSRASASDVAIGFLVLVYLAGAAVLARRLLRTRYYDFRIALTGQPGAGKTVFANLLYDQLMNGSDPRFEFTAESRSAIATYQAIRGISQDVWPASTTTGAVQQRDGVLRYGRRIVDLEIGDSAGQHWIQLTDDDTSTNEADYLQWVLSANALVHVIPADRMIADGFDAALRSDVEDLRLAARLMRSVSRTQYKPVPLLTVISKMDLLPGPIHFDEMLRVFTGPDADNFESTAILSEVGRLSIADLLADLGRELAREFRSVHFMYSSAEIVKGIQALGSTASADIPRWVFEGAVVPPETRSGRDRTTKSL